MATVLRFGRRVQKTRDNPHGWVELFKYRTGKKQPDSLLGHKSVLCFTGDGAIGADQLNGYCKNIESMLIYAEIPGKDWPRVYALGFDTLKTEDIRIQAFNDEHGVSWEHRPENEESQRSNKLSDKEIDHPQVFFDAYLKELIEDENGQPRTIEEIKKNFENLTIVTHCHGSVFAYVMEKMLAQKLKSFYPNNATELLGHLRMLHLATRYPISQEAGAKHFGVFSQDDRSGVDSWVAYDNAYQGLKRVDIPFRSSALLHMASQYDVLLAERLIGIQEDGCDDHEYFLNLFAMREKHENLSPEGLKIVSITQRLLRHFVEHPEDPRGVPEILSEIDSRWTRGAQARGKKIQAELNQEHARDSGLVSLLGKYAGSIGRMHTTHVGQRLTRDQRIERDQQRSFLYQEDEEGQVLYERVKEEYKKTGDSRSLINLIKVFGNSLPKKEVLELIAESIKTNNWILCRTLISRGSHVELKRLIPVLKDIPPTAIKHIIPLLTDRVFDVKDESFVQGLVIKSKQIKNTNDCMKVQNFLQSIQTQIDTQKKMMARYLNQRSPKETKQ